ncbi:membrane protein DedA with SNARE-associated domain [Mycoplana sp. BE70]|uniref:VTT domain-containing protein n=1 Tax=Mycoplana sp. BE70 TaxID=2817775 RepID=UPI00285DCB63|nr:VTT domain-containing protein [Mycoplana sp. BE70]MDR6759273.1 membrane protein DedA with SNARE-associated domain [Mycoplana sp. BE70]
MKGIEAITALVSAYPYVSYGIVLVLALSESLPVLGAAIPGTAIIVGLSVLVPSGVLKLYPLLASATAGAIIGDGFAFWLGHRYHREIADRWPFNRFPALIEKSEAFFHRHGGKSVFLARFTPGVRAFVPLVAGITQMSAGRFYAVNILSALVWAPAHILPGVFAGAFAASQGAAGTRLIVLLIILAAAAWLMLRLTRYAVLHTVPLIMYAVEMLRAWAKQTDNLASRLVLRLMGPTEGELPILALLIAILIGAAWLFFGIAEDVITGDPLIVFDKSVFDFLQGLRTRAADAVMIGVTELGDTTVVLAVSAAVLVLLAAQRSWRTAAYFLGAVGGASIFNTAIKVAVHRARPSLDLYAGWSNFSFPSGHSTEMLRFTGS